LTSAVIATAAVILWTAYIFSAIWLRVRCARELADRAEPLNEVGLVEHPNAARIEGSGGLFLDIDGSGGLLLDIGAWPDGSDTVDRLEALQRPSITTVFRQLLARWTGHEGVSAATALQTIAWSPSQLTAEQPDASQVATFGLTAVESPASISVGQTLSHVALLNWAQGIQCYAVTDSRGERFLVVVRPPRAASDDGEVLEVSSAVELLLIDSAGRILDRSPLPKDRLLGKLAQPCGKADQLVFGTWRYVSNRDGTFSTRFVVGPGTVRIIDNGQWRTVQKIDAPESSDDHRQPEQLASEASP
jgi:hypothetical protein